MVTSSDLAHVAHCAYRLHGGLKAVGGHADKNSKEAGAELTGDHLPSGAALTRLASTWESRVKTLQIATSLRDAQHRLMTPSRIAEYYN